MKNIFLDTNIIVHDPTILARRRQDVRLMVPAAVLQQIEQTKRLKNPRLSELIRQAADVGNIVITPWSAPAIEDSGKLDPIDISILSAVKRYQQEHSKEETILATQDSQLQAIAAQNNIPVLDFAALILFFSTGPDPDPDLLKKANRVILWQRLFIVISCIVGVLLTLLFQWALANFDLVISWLGPFLTAVALAIAGIVLFGFRSWFRLLYGVIEFAFGVVAVWFGVYHDFTAPNSEIIGVIKLLGGMYVMVRGMDNIGKGLQKTRYEDTWKKFFPER
jgi:rRNA-processing protein FCF1